MASATFKYVPQIASTTFAFSSVCFFFYGLVPSSDVKFLFCTFKCLFSQATPGHRRRLTALTRRWPAWPLRWTLGWEDTSYVAFCKPNSAVTGPSGHRRVGPPRVATPEGYPSYYCSPASSHVHSHTYKTPLADWKVSGPRRIYVACSEHSSKWIIPRIYSPGLCHVGYSYFFENLIGLILTNLSVRNTFPNFKDFARILLCWTQPLFWGVVVVFLFYLFCIHKILVGNN